MSELTIVFIVVMVIWFGIGFVAYSLRKKVTDLEKEIKELNEN